MDSIKNIKKQWLNSLVFLDNSIINSIIVVILVLYSSTFFENINLLIGNIYKFSIVKFIIILLIVYVSPKDTTIAILLAISYVVSLNYSIKESFSSSVSHTLMPNNNSSVSNTIITHNNSAISHNNSAISHISRPSDNLPDSKKILLNDKSILNTPMLSSYINKATSEEYNYPTYNIESFQGLPFQNQIDSPEITKNNLNISSNCMNNYVAKNESINNVCEPISGINNSLNAQGLNSPEGYLNIDNGSPL